MVSYSLIHIQNYIYKKDNDILMLYKTNKITNLWTVSKFKYLSIFEKDIVK